MELSYFSEEGQAVVSSEGPDLPERGRDGAYGGRDEGDNYYAGHNASAYIAAGYVVEVLDKWITCVAAEDSLGVGDGEAEREDRDVA